MTVVLKIIFSIAWLVITSTFFQVLRLSQGYDGPPGAIQSIIVIGGVIGIWKYKRKGTSKDEQTPPELDKK